MEKDKIITVSEAVHKIQLALLDGIKDENHLFAAGCLMCKSDYKDVVTERTIINLCGYPLCPNSLPPENPKKGQYRISIKEHKVYDLHETYLYCCSTCLINSKAFVGSLKEERSSGLNPAKINEVLRLFDNEGLKDKLKNGDSRLAKLVIKENDDSKGGDVSVEDWIGPSNAIEGYVPLRDRLSKASVSEGSDVVQNGVDFEVNHSQRMDLLSGDVNFTSMIIINDEFTAPKKVEGGSNSGNSTANKGSKATKSVLAKSKDSLFGNVDFMSTIITQDEYSVSKLPSSQMVSDPNQLSREFSEKLELGYAVQQSKLSEESPCLTENSIQISVNSAVIGAGSNVDQNTVLASLCHEQNGSTSSSRHLKDEAHSGKAVQSSKLKSKSSLKTSGVKRVARSVSWADEKSNGLSSGNLCEVREYRNSNGSSTSKSNEAGEDDDSQRLSSAEACAMALLQAAEAVSSGQSDVNDAVSEAGIVVLPQRETANEGEHSGEDNALEDIAPEKWPKKPGNLNYDIFDSDNSWFDPSPEGFSLTLSSFALMWNALFSWVTSSSLAYIYGREESVHEEYMFTNGREYPSKIVLPDGRSPEIKHTLAGCLARALPGLIADLKLPTPVSTLEHEVACLLNTMSFVDSLPPFRMKQWKVIALLFIDALSVCRIPGLTAYLTSRRILIPKVLNGAQVSAEEYEIMKDLMIPLGRVPQFTMQSGG